MNFLLNRQSLEEKFRNAIDHFEKNKKDQLVKRGIYLYGPPGCGKTTLLKLILGLHHCSSGSVMIDGANVQQLRADDMRKNIGVVLQNPYLFSGTLRENIGFGLDVVSDEEILEQDAIIEKEIKDGIIPDPSAVDPITGQPLEGGGDLGAVPTEPDLESDAMATDAQFQKDVKSAEI